MPYPKWVWTPTGGYWCNPPNWKRNTAICAGVWSVVLYFGFKWSSANERRYLPPVDYPIPSQYWCKHACEDDPRVFACCAHTQHYTWLRVARLLSELIVDAYGDQCGSRLATDAALESTFRERFGALVRAVQEEPEGVEGTRRSTAWATLAWAYRGVCEERGHRCPDVNASLGLRTTLDTLAARSDLTWTAERVCTVS